MRILWRFNKNIAKISLLFFAIAITSCNALKRVGDNDLLLTKNNVYTNNQKINDEDVESLIVQKKNSTILGYPLRLNLYNLAKKNPDSSFQSWLYKKEKREQRLVNLLSKKQVNRLGESFLVKGMSVWLKNIGEAPSIIDTSKTTKTLERLSAYYDTKGYFNNNTTFKIDSSKRKKRAAINYKVALGKPFKLDSVSKKITSTVIDSIYLAHKSNSFVKSGQQFDLNNFNNERERLTYIFRNNGIYNFQESSISYDIATDTTKTANDQLMNVKLVIAGLKVRGDSAITTSNYKIAKFNKVNIYTDYLYDSEENNLQSIEYNNYTIYYKDKLRYKPKTLVNAIFFKKDSIYRDLDKIRTYRQITSLNVFKYPSINFDQENNTLDANIYLASRSKYALETNLEITRSNIRRLGVGFGSSLLMRNIFKGAETLSLSAKGTFGLLSNSTLLDNFFSEIGGDINLNFPRIWLPFINTDKIIPNYFLPQTRATIGTSFQKNIGLDKQTFNTILGYNWTPSDFKQNTVELLNIQYVNNKNTNRFFEVYQSSYDNLDKIADNYETLPELSDFFRTEEGNTNAALTIPEGTNGFMNAVLNNEIATTTEDKDDVSSIKERQERLTENNLIFASNYTFSKNNKKGITDNNYYQFRFKLESAGNFLSGLSYLTPFKENEDKQLLVFNVPYSQYIKTELDYIKYWDLNQSNVLAFRSFTGIAIPYGNSDNIPFVRSYFAGGSNDNRAWFPYSLGPGKTDAINDFNEANFKIALNLEYRFPVLGNFNGAIFADAGNIWNVFDNVEDPNATFNGIESLKDIALGTGFGVRYDATYFIFRVDLGFKTYNPAEITSKRWFRDYNFGNSVLQIGINYPF
ncbi:surface antigen-like protein [Maribacter vaceletii]|uniref:Surface antigen-like protein n=1 Tax=Maribacter vaceletii TaxID=1206816 RepID=A0A495DTD1_9FLAO|nr:BamA/TamA family outer membrane protein [Maribacter vaceletii]RKR07830.1 surface antigen-like protein [Maribacter vaceletii]